uniref:Uncharacterized protein n=1 Tax=Strongyloides venezuelensis TaxID=75913 RepID=A0A0K0FLE4_STRVS
MIKTTQEEEIFNERVRRDVKLLGTWKLPTSENTENLTNEIETDGLNLTIPTDLPTKINEIKDQTINNILINSPTTTTEATKTIHFLKPSDIITATGSRTVLSIPPINQNTTHEVIIIANDGNATVIKGHNSVSIKASSTIE